MAKDTSNQKGAGEATSKPKGDGGAKKKKKKGKKKDGDGQQQAKGGAQHQIPLGRLVRPIVDDVELTFAEVKDTRVENLPQRRLREVFRACKTAVRHMSSKEVDEVVASGEKGTPMGRVLNAVFRSENNEEATPATTLLPDEMRPGDFFEARVVPAVLLEQVVHHCKRWGEQDAKKAQGGGKVVKLDTKRQTG